VRLGLLEASANTLSVVNRLLSRVVEAGSEFREGFQFLKLRVSKLEATCDCAICSPLRRSADARNRLANVDCREDSKLKQSGRKVDLPVGDGDQVSRDVSGYVLRFGFDDGQRRERSASPFLAEMGRAFQHSRMNIEDVAGEGFTSRRTAEQK
jgi:hypothetical protein